MSIVMKSNHFAIVFIDPGSGDHRASKVASNVFDDCLRVTDVGFCENIKTIFVIRVTFGFDLFEGRADTGFHFIEQSSAEGIAKISVTKDFDVSPKSIVAVTALGDQAMDMRIPFQVTA